ncbi:flagellar hook capping protein [Sphingomonas gilva]|uniref:Basal-body rod modification protein FlgD n=1 Tax=Sphingomonas gilva TaxID=2305907 RepID=A0A396RRY3_9SPHN|nr:flagellar hook capping FlgD N-terminal domain-containing protein [Sphingomonas gilva]RHW19437.1 flagellar hook capping protein [Sphingomonas gilva]
MQVAPITGLPGSTAAPAQAGAGDTASSAFGMSFEALLKIVLTQLTYQDPLKPMENFEFVSQLAQFSQIQQGQTMNDSLELLVSAQATNQATGLLGKRVDIPQGSGVLTGTVIAIAFESGTPVATIKTPEGLTISDIAISSVQQIRQGE